VLAFTDAHLASWVLQWFDTTGDYTGSGTQGWVTINSGTGPVSDGVLGVWDTDGLPRCAYAVRLLVSDQTLVGSASCSFGGQGVAYQLALNVGLYCPTTP